MNGLALIEEQFNIRKELFKLEDEDNKLELVFSLDANNSKEYDSSERIGIIELKFKTNEFEKLGSLNKKDRLAIIGAVIVNEINNLIDK